MKATLFVAPCNKEPRVAFPFAVSTRSLLCRAFFVAWCNKGTVNQFVLCCTMQQRARAEI